MLGHHRGGFHADAGILCQVLGGSHHLRYLRRVELAQARTARELVECFDKLRHRSIGMPGVTEDLPHRLDGITPVLESLHRTVGIELLQVVTNFDRGEQLLAIVRRQVTELTTRLDANVSHQLSHAIGAVAGKHIKCCRSARHHASHLQCVERLAHQSRTHGSSDRRVRSVHLVEYPPLELGHGLGAHTHLTRRGINAMLAAHAHKVGHHGTVEAEGAHRTRSPLDESGQHLTAAAVRIRKELGCRTERTLLFWTPWSTEHTAYQAASPVDNGIRITTSSLPDELIMLLRELVLA